jgi:hypothetical protein
MRRISLILMACSSGFAAPALAGDCRPEFVESTETVDFPGIQIGVGEFSRETFAVHVRNAGDGDCSATIRVRRIGASAPETPRYTLQSGATVFEILAEGAAPTAHSDLPVANAPSDDKGANVSFQLTLPTEWGLQSGFYGELVELSLLDPTGAEADTLTLSLNIDIPRAVALRVVGATGDTPVARIHLGALSSTAPTTSDPFGVRIWSTAGYRVPVASENRGQLVHDSNLDHLPYELDFDQRVVNLEGADSFFYPQHTPSLGRLHPLRVRVAPVDARAGDYADRVTVTVTAV